VTAEKFSLQLKTTLTALDNLFFPPTCLHCGAGIDSAAQVLCGDCILAAQPILENYCDKCGSPLRDYNCPACSETDFAFDLARSAYVYKDPVESLVHQLKYNSLRSPARFFATALLNIPAAGRFAKGYDLVSSVPLHHVRKRDRGYNQSELIARKLARELGLPYGEPVFRKINTLSQTNLSSAARRANLQGAFALRKNANLAGKRVILLDDVFTTGSTVNEIAQLLKSGGAAKVLVLTATRAV
jgi:ComF family protein